MNPFEHNVKPVEENVLNWLQMYPKPYNKKTADPFTKVRVILANGTEFESQWFLHQLARHCPDNDMRREAAQIRYQEQQQQKRLGALKPLNENFLETTISYEQLAIELTAILAQNDKNANNVAALNFALLEDFDHLFRFANLLKKDFGIDAAPMVGKLTEVMPGRPTINEHRHPHDNVRYAMDAQKADPFSKLVANIITAAEQQTMNFYMNNAQNYHNDLGRKLFAEIGMVEEMHVTQYECLADPTPGWLEMWLMHEYTECYLYWSLTQDETDKAIKEIYNEHYQMEVAHLQRVAALLKKYEKKSYREVCPKPEFPQPLKFGQNKAYIRDVIKNTVWLTSENENYTDVRNLDANARYFNFNDYLNGKPATVASHLIIDETIKELKGTDYRYQEKVHPIPALDDRTRDNINVGKHE